jgi:lysine-N-methylase
MEEIAARRATVYERYYAPFFGQHEYMLENYLVNYVYRTLFPFGPQSSTYGLRLQNIQRAIHAEFMLLATYFSIIQTMLTGLAGRHQEAFGTQQVVQVIYTFTRTFEHSLAFPSRVTQTLQEKGLDNPAGVAVLLNP